MEINQNKFFDGLGFEEVTINESVCFKGPDGWFYRMDHFSRSYVIECAENEELAKLNCFDDADLFDDDLPEDELVAKVQAALQEYVNG